jgi:ABC-type multidrug transport system fused ATPase/permease subunit
VRRQLLRRLVRDSPGLVAVALGSALAESAIIIPIAPLVESLFDHHLDAGDSGAIVRAGVLILALYCAAALLSYASRVAVLRITTEATARLRNELVQKLHDLPQHWHDRRRAGEVHSLIVQDSERVERMLGMLASPILPAAVVSVALTVVAIVVSPELFLALLIAIPGLMLAMRLVARRTHGLAEEWAAASGRFAAEVQRMLRAVTLTKAHGAERQQVDRASVHTARLAERTRTFEAAYASSGALQGAVGAVAGSLVLIVGGIAVAHGTITIGALLGFYAVLALLVRQLQAIGRSMNDVAIGLESLTRIGDFLATPAEDSSARGVAHQAFTGAFALEGVTFAYDATPVLRGVDLEVRAGERVAVIGPNGAGKSTLVSVIIGLHTPQSGRVLADGVPLSELDARLLRRRIGVVLQDPVVFPGTIRENIAFGRPEATDAEVRAAASTATAAAFIDRLPQSYATEVGDEGVGLSGGQRQRIAIARALVSEPALLLLDEPTTYLDEAAVTALMANLATLPHVPTVVLVTHDPQAAKHADRVVELRDGEIVSSNSGLPTPGSGLMWTVHPPL